jgi:hypothetical protein
MLELLIISLLIGPCTRGIAITMIDKMEYIHTMYIITTGKY